MHHLNYVLSWERLRQHDINVSDVNNALKFFNLSLADKSSQPPMLTSFTSLKMTTSSEMLCFLHNLPLLIDRFIARDNPYWKVCLMLLDICDIVFAPAITEGMASFLSHLIAEHHEYFKEMLGDNGKLLPKHHLLVHYPSCLLKAGPPVRHWSMRFEARTKIFEDLAKSTHCFKITCLTLAMRFQLGLAYNFIKCSRQLISQSWGGGRDPRL